MEIKDSTVKFSSGRTRYANAGIIGIGDDDSVSEGYDGELWFPGEGPFDKADKLSPADLAELADYMIARWQEWKARVTSSSGTPQE